MRIIRLFISGFRKRVKKMNQKANLRFFLFLTAPVLTFSFMKNYVDSGNYENRQFAEQPKLSFETLSTFSSQYDAYFSDYLPYKKSACDA